MTGGMETDARTVTERVSDGPAAKYVFLGLLVLLLVIAVGHLYVLAGLTDLYLGLPLWLWLQLVVVSVMLGLAWIAVEIVSAPEGGSE